MSVVAAATGAVLLQQSLPITLKEFSQSSGLQLLLFYPIYVNELRLPSSYIIVDMSLLSLIDNLTCMLGDTNSILNVCHVLLQKCDLCAHFGVEVGANPPHAGHGHNCWHIALGITVNAS